jgi:dienelactone hydrolase
MGFGEAFTAMRRHAPRFCAVAAACGASLASVPAQTTHAGRSEIFRGPEGMAGLLHAAATGAPRSGAVLIVHDALGIDTRGHRYTAQLTAAGLVVLEVELRANPADDSLPEPLPSEAEAAGLVARAAAALANDPRVDPNRVGALGFGIGARAVALAPPHEDGRDAFAARVLLYPACGSLKQLVQAPKRAPTPVLSPVLLLHGEDDPSNSPAECDGLSAALGKTAPVRRISYRAAGYAWDLPQSGGSEDSRQHRPDGQDTILVRSWPELAELSAAQAAAFLAGTLSRAPGDQE